MFWCVVESDRVALAESGGQWIGQGAGLANRLLHLRRRRALAAAAQQFVDLAAFAYQLGFDSAIQAVADPAGDAQFLGIATGEAAKPHTLNAPVKHHMQGAETGWFVRHGRLHWRVAVLQHGQNGVRDHIERFKPRVTTAWKAQLRL